MVNYFIPLKRVGDFELNAQISNYADKYNFKHSSIDKSTGWETYSLVNEGISLYVEDGKIVSIVCIEECLYQGRNIIGMNINEFIGFYDIKPVGEIDQLYVNDYETQNVYEFDYIGLQIWCKEDTIVTAISSLINKNK